MNREDIQEEFRQQTKELTMTLNKCDVGINPKYVIWLEKRIIELSIPSISKQGEQLLKNNCTLNRQNCGKGSGCKYPHCHI